MKMSNMLNRVRHNIHNTAAVILAGGSSTRMGMETHKQLIKLGGIPIVVRTLLAYESASTIQEIIVVACKEEMSLYQEWKQTYNLSKLHKVVEGGNSRQQSALNGFEALSDKIKFVAVADAARPLIMPAQIDDVCRIAYRVGGAVAAWHPHDSVKLVNSINMTVAKSLDRDKIWMTQTPQVFSTDWYRVAVYSAIQNNFEATDDCALMERIGKKVALYDVGFDNIKITTPEDIKTAEMILRQRGEMV